MPPAKPVDKDTTYAAKPPSDRNRQLLRSHLDQRMGGLRVDRMSFWLHWQEIAKYIIPRRYKWLITPNQGNRGSPINQAIIDETGSIALRVLAAGMMAGITSPGRPWFKLTLDDPNLRESSAVKQWLEESAQRMRTVFAESNFYTSLATMYVDLGAFGTAALTIYEDFEDVIRCYVDCAGEYFLANSDRLEVDTKYREYVMTTAQVAAKFGIENCSASIQSAIKTGGAMLSQEIIVAHAIEPNPDWVRGASGPRGMQYRECYWEWGSGENLILRETGFFEKPFLAPRWDIVGNDAYGRSPGMDALPGIKQLQMETKRKAQAIDKLVNPPMVADVQLKNEPASLLPGGVTYVTNPNGVGFKPAYEVKPQLGEMMEDIQEVQNRIKQTFFYDLFLMISQLDTVRTATEIDARREEKLIQLGPVLERFENEALDPAINRTFNIMLRAGLLPPPPPELAGQHIKAEYVSMLAQAQKAAMTVGMERVAGIIGNLSAVFPEAPDNMDVDQFIDDYADLLGVSPKIIRSITSVMKIRQDRNERMAQQQAMQTTLNLAQGAKVLSETEVGGGQNALQAAVG